MKLLGFSYKTQVQGLNEMHVKEKGHHVRKNAKPNYIL